MKYGIDYLAGAKYGKVILDSHPNGWAAGFFSYVDGFGSSLSVAKKLLKTGRCPFIRFQLWWEDNHNFQGKDDKILEQARKVKKLAQEFPKIQFEVSPACEHKLSNPNTLLDKVAKVYEGIKNVEIINTPWLKGGGELSSKYKNEVHRDDNVVPSRGRFNFSYDGKAAVDMPVSEDKKRWGKAEYFFFWTHQLNLRKNEKDKTPRPLRKARPTKELIESLAYLATKKGKTKLAKGWLSKSHAEQVNDIPNPRENKLLIISDIKASHCELRDGKGNLVASAKYYGPFEGKQHRYYFYRWGYQLKGILRVCINGKAYGTINAGFREGYFR